MEKNIPNQLRREFLGVNGLNPFKGANSASREQMFSSHIGQCLVVKGSTERYIQTGMEREYGKYTFNIKMPHDGEIIRIIDLYRRGIDRDSIAVNPVTIVIYERSDTKEVGMLELKRYFSQHTHFGFEYKTKDGYQKLRPGAEIKAGTVFMESPSITDTGGYKYGVELNTAYMTHHATSEDGIMISRDKLHLFGFKSYETRVVEFGSKRIPLNTYGNDQFHKSFPDIGEYVREDGVLMALREHDDLLSVVEQSPAALREIDETFDRVTYVPANRRGRVCDIRVLHDPTSPVTGTPSGMETQIVKYDNARREFYQAIYDEYRRLQRERGSALVLMPKFHRLVVEAISVVGKNSQAPNEPVRKLYRKNPLDQWRIEFTIEYDIVPVDGFKLTDTVGGKGVICAVAEPEDMPVDAAGNRADIVMDPNSTISRMNLGRFYEQYLNACSRDIIQRIIAKHNLVKGPGLIHQLEEIKATNPTAFNETWQYLLNYYRIVSPRMYSWFVTGKYPQSDCYHLAYCINNFIYIYYPPDNEPMYQQMIAELKKDYRPIIGPVTYRGTSGEVVTTHDNVLIGSVYFILLEKIADDWAAVSSGKLQHFGVLSQVSSSDKYSTPARMQPVRVLGEAEVRIFVSYVGADVTAELLDRSNNPFAHEQVVQSILNAEQPTNIMRAVDRRVVPYGGSKPHQLVNHIAACGGWKFVNLPDFSNDIPRYRALEDDTPSEKPVKVIESVSDEDAESDIEESEEA